MIKEFKIIKKIKLTSSIFEIHYKFNELSKMKPWQFITFILPKIWWRAYSILKQSENEIVLIIKRVKKEEWWRWWSILLCDAKIWDKFNWVWPAGHFVLKEKDNNKLFIWTWTGLVPLYNQIVSWLERWDKSQYKLLFWSRKIQDLFYTEKFQKLSEKHSNFSYELFLSREDIEWINNWYVTDFLKKENTDNFSEFYICGTPNMIESAIEKLEIHWISKTNIFSEKY